MSVWAVEFGSTFEITFSLFLIFDPGGKKKCTLSQNGRLRFKSQHNLMHDHLSFCNLFPKLVMFLSF